MDTKNLVQDSGKVCEFCGATEPAALPGAGKNPLRCRYFALRWAESDKPVVNQAGSPIVSLLLCAGCRGVLAQGIQRLLEGTRKERASAHGNVDAA